MLIARLLHPIATRKSWLAFSASKHRTAVVRSLAAMKACACAKAKATAERLSHAQAAAAEKVSFRVKTRKDGVKSDRVLVDPV
jgi:hypothetical protein